MIKLWENKEIFGILESTNINNIRGTKVRDIFPCVLSNLGFNKSDAASAIYPTMSIEKIRYAVVTVGTVKNPTPELIPKYEEQQRVDSKSSSGVANSTTPSGGNGSVADDLRNAESEAKQVLNGISGGEPSTKAVKKDNIINLNSLNLISRITLRFNKCVTIEYYKLSSNPKLTISDYTSN